MASELKHCPFCSKTMMLRSALWPSEGDADAIIHADPTDCPMLGFSDGSADGSIIEKWNCSLSNEDDFPSDGSCVRCGSVPRNANGLCNTCLDEDAERLENTRPTPVAPVSPDATGKCGELVTVGNISEECLSELKQMLCGEIHPCNDIGDVTDADIELVTRENAEAVIVNVEAEKAKAIREAGWHFAKACMMAEEIETLKAARSQAEELVTVGTEHGLFGNHGKRELVWRSQAEELLAAERAENTRLQSENDAQADQISELQMTPWPEWATKVLAVIRKRSGYDGYGDAIEGVDLPAELDECIAAIEADNAALTARVKKLTQLLEAKNA